MLYHRHSWKALLTSLGMVQSEAQVGVPIARTYTKRQARRLLRPFEVKEMFVDHIFPYRVPDYREYRYTKKWYFRPIPDPTFRWLERRFGWHLCVTAEAS